MKEHADNRMTNREAFIAMTYFLEQYYEQAGSDDVGALLGDMAFVGDSQQTMDPAIWTDWLNAVEKMRTKTECV